MRRLVHTGIYRASEVGMTNVKILLAVHEIHLNVRSLLFFPFEKNLDVIDIEPTAVKANYVKGLCSVVLTTDI